MKHINMAIIVTYISREKNQVNMAIAETYTFKVTS
jgi:hypothetical protein